jgi:hypothetical protein
MTLINWEIPYNVMLFNSISGYVLLPNNESLSEAITSPSICCGILISVKDPY